MIEFGKTNTWFPKRCFVTLALYPALIHAVEPNQFVDISVSSGVAFTHQTTQTILTQADFLAADSSSMDEVENFDFRAEITSSWLTGGVASGDYDGDGLPDIFAIGGDDGVARLFHNDGNDEFSDQAGVAGVAITGERQAGATFADYDGDGDLDLFVGGVLATRPRLFRNNGPNELNETTFTDVFESAFPDYDLDLSPNNFSGGLGDYDGDGDLDLFFSHSMTIYGSEDFPGEGDSTQHLWTNNTPSGGAMSFSDVSIASGITAIYESSFVEGDHTFSSNFADLNEDNRPDLLIVSDQGDSLVLLNAGDQTFTNVTVRQQFRSPDFSVVAGMGAAVADFDHDGHLDWFVSQIRREYDGNQLFKGRGDGTFMDLVQETDPFPAIGVESGHWGWGSCFADLDNDRLPDIVEVNGFNWNGNPLTDNGLFSNLPVVAFISNGDGTFMERAAYIGLDDVGDGRGISCVDYDRDGDIDVAISNHRGAFKLYKNTLTPGAANGFVTITLSGDPPNTMGVGARVILRSNNIEDTAPTQLMQEISVDANFVSSNPIEAHFGLGDWVGPFEAEVRWPDGKVSVYPNILRNTFMTLTEPKLYQFRDGFE